MYTICETSKIMLTLLALSILRYYILLFVLFTHPVLFSVDSLDWCEGKSKMYIAHESYNIWWTWFSITLWSYENREPCSQCSYHFKSIVVCTVPHQCIWIRRRDYDHQKPLHSQLRIFLIAKQTWGRCWYPFLRRKTCHLHWLVSKLHYLTVWFYFVFKGVSVDTHVIIISLCLSVK